MSEATSGTLWLQLPHISCAHAGYSLLDRYITGFGPCTANLGHVYGQDLVRSPATTEPLPLGVHSVSPAPRAPAWIDPVILRAITISWNDIVIPVGSRRYDGHPDDGPFPWFTNGLRMRCGTKRAQVAQDHGCSQSYDRYPHALTSLPHTACNPDIQRCSSSCRCQWAYRTSNAPEPQRLIYEDGGLSGSEAARQHFI